jgi:hypothetical protein
MGTRDVLRLLAPVAAAAVLAGPMRPAAEADKYLPWEGGSAYYKKWVNGPPSEPGFFPISVWYQSLANAARYKAIGVNQYIGPVSRRPGEGLELLQQAGIALIGSQSAANMASPQGNAIHGWFLFDEPDNAQSKPGGGYGSCILPPAMIEQYQDAVAKDATRPAFLNFGQAVVNEKWPGRGSDCSGHYEHYPEYIEGADIVSYDVYPVNNNLPLWWVGEGVDRLRKWADYKKPVWDWIETTAYNAGPKPTPGDVKAEVWMSIIHGAMGVGYFCHVFKPAADDAGPLDDPQMHDALAVIDAQVRELAPALNTPPVANGVATQSSNPATPVETMLKRQGGATYLLAMGARPGGATVAMFKLRGAPRNAVATVLGESRKILVKGGVFEDRFTNYQVHLYKLNFTPGK